MDYNLNYNIAAFFIFLVILVMDVHQKKTSFLQNKIFTILMALGLAGVTITTIGSFMDMNPGSISLKTLRALHYLHFILIGSIPFVYTLYNLALTEVHIFNLNKRFKVMVLVPEILELLLILSNAFAKSLFYYDENGLYRRGNLQVLFYLIVFYYGLFGAIYASIYKEATTKRLRMALYSFFAIGFLSSVIQIVFPELQVQYFGISICGLVVSFMIQRPEEYLDSTLGVFNKNAFSRILSLNIHSGKKMQVLLICIEDLKFLNQTVGSGRMNEYLKLIAEFLDYVANQKVYLLTSSTFAILFTEETEEERESIVLAIQERFTQEWVSKSNSLNLVPRMMQVEVPEDTSDLDTIISCCVYLRKLTNMPDKVLKAREISLTSADRTVAVEKCIKDAIRNDSFEMYYQPIYSVEHERICSAEALVRLYEPGLGFIPPDEFIPIAERNGSIIKVGEQIFHKVFSFLKEEKLEEKGIAYMEINLSIVQCMQEGLAQQILDLMKQYEIEVQYVNLEITETAAANLPKLLLQNMRILSENQVRFSLDDFGTGYSNFSSVMSLPLDLIKFDKTLIDLATESEKGRNILNSLTVMVKNMNVRMVAEGVETKEQKDMLIEMGVDYLQGYYFSKPLPKDEFIKYIKNFNKENFS